MTSDLRRRLEDRVRLLEVSIADAQLEHANGELDDAAFSRIVAKEQARLDEVRSEIEGLPADEEGDGHESTVGPEVVDVSSRRSRRPTLMVVAGAALVLAAVVLIVGLRGSSGPSSADIPPLLTKANGLVNQGKVTQALPIYAKILEIDRAQPEALAQRGWLTFEAGNAAGSTELMGKGETQVRASVALAPKAFAPRLYLGVIELVGNSDPKAALAQLEAFASLNPPAGWVEKAKPYVDKARAQLASSTTTTVPGG